MLVMNDCAIDPGDILFVVTNSKKPLALFKQAAQSLTTSRSKHGHREVISVFVCTGKNKYGVMCNNFERKLSLSTESFIKTLQEKTVEELSVLLLNYCTKELTRARLKEALATGPRWMRRLAKNVKGIEDKDELIEQFITASKENKDRLIQLLVTFWRATGQADILPVVNSSLLLFKHTDSKIRQQFLDAYLEQVKLTEKLHAEGKVRTSLWVLIKSFFQWSSQDKKDREKNPPSEATYCSRNLMQVLNQVDPNLVDRGRNVLPKALEAGLREATKRKIQVEGTTNQQQLDEFEDMVAAQEQSLPPFTLQILPSSGRKLMSTLLEVVDNEIIRIESKWWTNEADKKKASDLKQLLLPFRDPKLQTYPVNLQVDIGLELIATLLPTLQRKTGLLGAWFPATSYSHVRAFARTQGIFDGDIRETVEKLKNKPPRRIVEDKNTQEKENKLPENSAKSQIYIFADWSFSSWSTNKRELLLEHMIDLLAAGHSLYTWENEQLVKMNKESLQNAINGEDFDDLLVSKLTPATRTVLAQQAKQQKLDTTKIQFLDYKACQNLVEDREALEVKLDNIAPLFATKLDNYHLGQTKQNIIDIEIANIENNQIELVRLQQLKERIATQMNVKQTTFQSGIDTKAYVSQPQYRTPIFKSVDLITLTPSRKYYRNEVYSDLTINENPTSPFQYFELLGMNATENLVHCKYKFHANGITKDLIKRRKEQSKLTMFEGEKSICLTSDWQALPSLDPNEKLLDIALKGLKKDDFEIKYSKENHLYYIRLAKPKTAPIDVTVHLLLRMSKHYRANPVFNTLTKNPEHQEVHRLLMKYLKFGKDHGKLRDSVGVSIHNGHEYLNEARKQGIASCRLRAIAFKEEMKRLYPEIPVSVVVNSDHCFIEMKLDGSWQRYCLGGYRDTPSFMESMKEDILTSLNADSRKHRFFYEKPTASQIKAPVEQIAMVV
ncbi:hypothetical protein [Legionella sainthelensi]|uniref:hypothetical protein n=1 Tax=Legionella sainthelensi TaxID=28087 RepID=UPI000E1FD0A9|nr:hypothetical protein [Legionella sainthelensi]